MSQNLRQEIDGYTQGALSSLNAVCRKGCKGHITVVEDGPIATLIFTAYREGKTQHFEAVTAMTDPDLIERIRTAEEIRLLRRTAGNLLRAQPVLSVTLN